MLMRRIDQGPSHYEVELRQADHQDERTGTSWRPIRRVRPDGAMAPLEFGSLQAAQAHAERLKPKAARIAAVARDGWRRVVDEAGT